MKLISETVFYKPAQHAALPRNFYARETRLVAMSLLGKILTHRTPQGICSGRIVETEAYLGENDPACHARAGRTKRTEIFYGEPGIAYVYLNYGLHFCLNAVTLPKGQAGCVLIRALEPIEGIAGMKERRGTDAIEKLASGPGKLTQALGIGRSCNGIDLVSGPLFIQNSDGVFSISKSKRIGITRAADLPLRFFIAGNKFISRV